MSPRRVGPDFHLVELTAEGKALAAGTPLRISNGRISVLFPADGQPVKVARFEWDMLLRDHAHSDGSRLFSIVIFDGDSKMAYGQSLEGMFEELAQQQEVDNDADPAADKEEKE